MEKFLRAMFRTTSTVIMGILRVIVLLVCIYIFINRLFALRELWKYGDSYTELGLASPMRNIIYYLGSSLIAIMALAGAHGALNKKPEYLYAFSGGIAIIATLGILLLVFFPNYTDFEYRDKQIKDKMVEMARNYQFRLGTDESPNGATRTWDLLQRELICCGLNDPEDWKMWKPYFKIQNALPSSCCNLNNGICYPEIVGMSYADGCHDKVLDLTNNNHINNILDMMKQFALLFLALIAFALAKYYGSSAGPK